MLAGIIILFLGIIYLFDILIPSLVIDYSVVWPSILILISIYFIFKKKTLDFGNTLVFFIGIWWLLVNLDVIAKDYTKIFWPLVLILIGVSLIFGTASFTKRVKESRGKMGKDGVLSYYGIFGGVNEKVKEKDFKGAAIYAIFGGVELDFSAIEIEKDVEIIIYSVFGGSDIIMPKDYNIKLNSTAVLGGNENKCNNEFKKNRKTINVTCISVFGGSEIK